MENQRKTGNEEACIETNEETKIERNGNTKSEDMKRHIRGKEHKNGCGKKRKSSIVKDEGRM
jgi:hypothetical protein